MKKMFIFSLLISLLTTSFAMGCMDEKDPEYWLEKMYDRPWREKSLKTLKELFNKVMQENKNDLQDPNVRKVIDTMVPELIKGFKEFTRDKFNRADIINLLAQMKDKRAVDIFMEGLEFERTSDSSIFQDSASALKRQGTEAALPKLIKAHEFIDAARQRRASPFTNTENEIEQAFISSATSILRDNPGSSHKAAIVKALCSIVETPDTKQELRLNMKALKGLGKIGDPASIPTLIKGVAMKGKRQPIGLGTIAFASLQRITDRDAVVDAMINFANKNDQSFNRYYAEELKTDMLMKNPNWYNQEAINFFGRFNYPSKKVMEFLNSQMNHMEPDETDEASSKVEGLPVNFDAEGWATMRRNWATVALAQLSHKPVLDVIKERLVFKKKTLQVQAEEAVGYVRALGLLQYPKESCALLLKVSKAGGDSLRDKTFYNAANMCGKEFLKFMKNSKKKIDCDDIVAQRFPDGASEDEEKQARNECDIMKKRIQGYIDRINYGEKCGQDISCYAKTLDNHTSPYTERSLNSLYRIGRDTPAKRPAVIKTILKNLHNTSKVSVQAAIFALDRLTPKGGTDELTDRISEVYKEFARQSTYKDRARLLEAFIGRVKNRR